MSEQKNILKEIREYITGNSSVISIFFAFITVIIAVISLIVSYSSYNFDRNREKSNQKVLVTIGSHEIPLDEENNYHYFVFEYCFTTHPSIDTRKLHWPYFFNDNNTAIQNFYYNIIVLNLWGKKGYATINPDSLYSWVLIHPFFERTANNVFENKNKVLPAKEFVGINGPFEIESRLLTEMYAEMGCTLSYDNQLYPFSFHYWVSYVNQKEKEKDYLNRRNRLMSYYYEDLKSILKRYDLEQSGTRCYLIIGDTTVLFNDPEFLHVHLDNNESITERISKYPMKEPESIYSPLFKWVFIILSSIAILYFIVVAFFLSMFAYFEYKYYNGKIIDRTVLLCSIGTLLMLILICYGFYVIRSIYVS